MTLVVLMAAVARRVLPFVVFDLAKVALAAQGRSPRPLP